MASSKPADSSSNPSNAPVLAALQRLQTSLQDDDRHLRSAPHLSHYNIAQLSQVPGVATAYTLLHEAATMVHGTSTKYTLIGKISLKDQENLSQDLLRGCELMASATHALLQDGTGCIRPLRNAVRRACLAMVINVIKLVESFVAEDVDSATSNMRTGAVWQSCDTVLKKLLPKGNRNAMRRDLLTWTKDCQETLEEFQELVDESQGGDGGERDTEEEDDFGFGDEQYTTSELEVIRACLPLFKCSKGSMKCCIQASDEIGNVFVVGVDNDGKNILDAIIEFDKLACVIGKGVTTLGSLLYPPIESSIDEINEKLREQVQAIITLQDQIISNDLLPPDATEFANVIRTAAENRREQAETAIQKFKAENEA